MNNHSLSDSYSRKVNYLRISITDRCNLRCRYCMPENGLPFISHHDILRYEEIIRVITLSCGLGFSKVRITGGEPLVRRGLPDFIQKVSVIPGLTDLALTTNGILLKEFASALKSAGLRRVNISLDSLRPDRFRYISRTGDLSRTLDGIFAALSAGFSPVKVNVVIVRDYNLDELLDFSRISQDYPVEVRFIELMPVYNTPFFSESSFVSGGEIYSILSSAFELHPVDSNESSPHVHLFQIANASGRIGLISPLSKHFCSVCNRLRLTADGFFRVCLFQSSPFNVKSLLRGGASDQEISDFIRFCVWKKPESHHLHSSFSAADLPPMYRVGG